jgi:general secretion pathway protein B
MSFILDALKKSEIERQRQALPGLIDVPAATKRRRLPWWAMLLGGLLIANVVVLAIVLVRNGTFKGAAARAATPPLNSPSGAAVAANPRPFSPLDSAPQYAPEIPVQNDPSLAPTATSAAAQPAVPAAMARALRHSDPLLSQKDAAADNDEVLPSINELSLSGQETLPELHLDVHVYGTKPAERFVYINMRKYHEGATLQEGPVVERIRRDGAVLNFRGVRFLLPRQS